MAKVHKMILDDGKEISMSLSYRKLARLSESNSTAWYKYNEISVNGAKSEMDLLRVLYTAYLCEMPEEPMTWDEFLDVVPEDRTYMLTKFGEVFGTGKK